MEYTLKQIIFGLRREYLDIEKQLTDLKQYVSTSSKVDDFYFHLEHDPCEMFLYLKRKENLLDKIERMLGTYIHGTTNFNVTDSIFNSYIYGGRELCTINNIEGINDDIRRILQSEFARNIVCNDYLSIPCDNMNSSILIAPGSISLINDTYYQRFEYRPRSDEIYIENEFKNITLGKIYYLLSLSIDSTYLNSYHCDLIDSFEDKDLIIEDNFNSNKATLQIIEEPKRLILTTKK